MLWLKSNCASLYGGLGGYENILQRQEYNYSITWSLIKVKDLSKSSDSVIGV